LSDGYLALENLTKRFRGPRGQDALAVDDVSLSLPRGHLLTLLGPSGCGKTTTLRLIAGFEQPTEGRIFVDGQDITEQPANRRGMAMVFQSYAIFPHLNVFENVAYGLRVKNLRQGEIRKSVAEALDLVGLLGFENRQPNQLSGGQQQRVALARALVMKPKLLLFDEPLSNLDAKLRLQMREQIRQIQQELSITAVYVTHDQAEAMVLSDQIVVMNQGRVEQAGTPAEVYRRPATAFVADFIGKANFVKGTVQNVQADRITVAALGGQLSVSLDQPPPLGDEVILVIRPDAIDLRANSSSFLGMVQRSFFLGSQADYVVEVAGETLSVVEHDPHGAVPSPPGTEVRLSFVEDTIALLPKARDGS
jgi:iron(III) transport system ATP-binding protein